MYPSRPKPTRTKNKTKQDGPYFGPLKCNEEYVGKSRPALVANIKEFHADVRDYTIDVLRERLAATQTALDHSADRFYKNLRANGEFEGACGLDLVAIFLYKRVC